MANNSSETQDNIFAAILLQLNNQFAQQVIMEKELQSVRSKLDQASLKLAQKEQLIGSLEQDLEHMIDQLTKIQHAAVA
ncbi:MAG TPA: hypothetical protein VLG38_02375 [Gammaproteobacteria bacterium]|nr:hypothetical protein [Gammaproteobacteria bacterium]